MAKISIILAVYNGENTVEKCLDSLQNQTLKDIEIICVDDGSTDATLSILNNRAKEDPRIKVFSQGENKKLLLAIKRGIKEATGEYLMFVDADDFYELNGCKRVLEIIETDRPDVVYFGTNLVEPDVEVSSEFKKNRNDNLQAYDWKYKGKNTLNLEYIKYMYLWNKAIKSDVCRKAYDSIPDVEMLWHSDMYACQMIHYYAKSLVSISDRLINYNYAKGLSAKQHMTAETFDYFCKCTRIYEDGVTRFFEKHNEDDELKRFREGYKERVMLYICTWRDKVVTEESAEALEALLKYYDAKDVIPMLKRNYYDVNVARKKHLKMLQDNYLK